MKSDTVLIEKVLKFKISTLGAEPREERVIEGIFGNEYLQYKNKVRRWV